VPVVAPFAGVSRQIKDAVRTYVTPERAHQVNLSRRARPVPDEATVSPREFESLRSARRFLPLGLGRQFFARPMRKGASFRPGDSQDRFVWIPGRSPRARNTALVAQSVPEFFVPSIGHFAHVDVEGVEKNAVFRACV